MPKDFISLADWAPEDLRGMLVRARELKELLREGERSPPRARDHLMRKGAG